MAPRLPFSLDRLPGLPTDVLAALKVLPGMARDTAAMARHTEVLDEVAAATGALPELREEMARVAAATESIARIDARMATIEEAMPVLVAVQQHLSQLPETMDRLELRLEELSATLGTLQESLGPIGRLAQRMPGGRRGAKQAADTPAS